MRVLYVDVDGTLVGPGGDLLGNGSTRVVEALLRARQAGLDVVPVSGRGEIQVFELCRLLGLSRGLAELGCVLVEGGEVKVLTGVWSAARMKDEGALDVALGLGLTLHGDWNRDRKATWLLRGSVDLRNANKRLNSVGHGWCELVDNGVARSGDHIYHLVPAGMGKASGVRADRSRHGLALEDTGYVGDSASDLACAADVGKLWLVANADPELPAQFRTQGSYGDGVAEVVDEVLAMPDRA